MTRSGAEYLAGLRNDRAVYLNGERVGDVTTHPAFAEAARSVAALYDLAHDPANRAVMTFPSPRDGRPVNKSWLVPRTRDDLTARRVAIKRTADRSYGLLGRSPDHVASFFAGFAGALDFFARGGQQFADNLARFYAKACDEDLYLSYAIVQPSIDRAKPAHQQPEPYLYAGVAGERDGGIVLRGAQMLATGGPISDWVLVTVILPLRPGDEDYAFSVVVPLDAPGLKLYCRRPYAIGPTSVFDYPLSTRFDEMDALVVLDDVFVPWEHVFVYKNLELTAGQFGVTSAHVLGNTQAHIRSWAKLQFLAGLVRRIAERGGTLARPDVLANLGDLATRVSLVEGLIMAAEAQAAPDPFGVMRPCDAYLYASQVLQQAMYPEIMMQVRGLMGGSVIQLPSAAQDLLAPETAADVNRYVRWPAAGGEERVKLLKLLWDLVGSEFGSRHLQYEMFYAGEPNAIKGREYRSFDWAAAERLVDHCLQSYDLRTPAASTTAADGAPAVGGGRRTAR
ncbi:MAG TPA: 4-hydroxyphenylacetate 3-hydroxylase N-terminal domain-containing protein [Chloroflexota bacterium]|nr:4-hydroxyphenylacetate 3-hydroxylase N-terminal domain-containing protein [Chloroflexota bacterium]